MENGFHDKFDLCVDAGTEVHHLERHPFIDRSPVLRAAIEQAEVGRPSVGPPPLLFLSSCIEPLPESDILALYLDYVRKPNPTIPAAWDKLPSLLRLYVLAHNLEDKHTSNIVMGQIIPEVMDDTMIVENIVLVWKSTEPECALRRFLVDCQIHGCFNVMEQDFTTLSVDGDQFWYTWYLQDVLTEFLILTERHGSRGLFGQGDDIFHVPFADRDKCHYHDHDNEVPRSP